MERGENRKEKRRRNISSRIKQNNDESSEGTDGIKERNERRKL